MEKIKKNFGFGFMRLPMKDGEIDTEETKRHGGCVSGRRIQLF